ncbi:hypothetical protein LZ198_18090 [Myxococcus sp. K15C18031901]|uniref:hypothetical protein n=1 Tax=Myxococcus dinghuensis TaxID=2906761 RepID=UPI0020A80808|nr:hypothetical protein [Myxococcus dinghuensis]MCP3100784.1 hypothetical protein [Myxococcus dinghuensis]
MKLFTKPVAIVCSILGLMGTAHAGAKLISDVTVNTASRIAGGSMADARKSADVLQYIACRTVAQRAGASYAVCEARDAWGTYGQCTTWDTGLIAAVQGIGPSSYVLFKWDAAEVCTNIEVHNSSQYAPMTP